MPTRAAFIDSSGEAVFVLLRMPTQPVPRGCVLFVPSFAEEMNKCRRMVTLASLQFVEAGFATACFDFRGTGDSGGELASAGFDAWMNDIDAVARYCGSLGAPVTVMTGIRLGATLAALAALRCPMDLDRLILWQPVLDGRRFADQFLRLRAAVSMMGDGGRVSITQLRKSIEGGEVIEIAGYPTAAGLLRDLDGTVLIDLLKQLVAPVHWFEVTRSDETPTGTPAVRAVEMLREMGKTVEYQAGQGESFWTTTEITTVPWLIDASLRVVAQG